MHFRRSLSKAGAREALPQIALRSVDLGPGVGQPAPLAEDSLSELMDGIMFDPFAGTYYLPLDEDDLPEACACGCACGIPAQRRA